jgi:hypothetical protein
MFAMSFMRLAYTTNNLLPAFVTRTCSAVPRESSGFAEKREMQRREMLHSRRERFPESLFVIRERRVDYGDDL